jgi:hypothetical protein
MPIASTRTNPSFMNWMALEKWLRREAHTRIPVREAIGQ